VTAYFGERDRVGRAFLADRLIDLFERHAFQAGVLLRGCEGFGGGQRLQTQRFLSLSEDLPLVAVGVDTRARVESALPEIEQAMESGLLTVERARLIVSRSGAVEGSAGPHEETKLTVYCGRAQRIAGRPAATALVALLRRQGVAGATVLLGVDGTAHGERRRARFFSRNADVPLMVVSVGSRDSIARALPELSSLLERPLVTVERVRVCKRDGQRLAEPAPLPERDELGLPLWQKLTIYAGEQSRHEGRPLSVELIRRLREAGAAGATALRGTWGYHGDHDPHGDRVLSLRRHVPMVTVLVDRPGPMRGWWEIVDELTDETGLVTAELVPAFRAPGVGQEHGGLRLARLRD
jgi:PII-like signaling protein